MAEALDGAFRQMVCQRTGIQKAWVEVSYHDICSPSSIQESWLKKRRADDLIPEENDTVQLALKRLPPKEAYDRVFRLRRAFQVQPPLQWRAHYSLTFPKQASLAHQLLPPEEQTKPEEV